MTTLVATFAVLVAVTAPAHSDDSARALGLEPPVSVVVFDQYADGGSLGGVLLDSTGVEYHIFRKVMLFGGGPSLWYVGADYNSGLAALLPEIDPRKDAIRSILVDWLDRTYTAAEQAQLLADPRHDPRPDYKEPPLLQLIKISEPDSSVLADTTLSMSERRCEFNSHFASEYSRYPRQRDMDKARWIMKFLGRRADRH